MSNYIFFFVSPPSSFHPILNLLTLNGAYLLGCYRCLLSIPISSYSFRLTCRWLFLYARILTTTSLSHGVPATVVCATGLGTRSTTPSGPLQTVYCPLNVTSVLLSNGLQELVASPGITT